MKNSKKSLAFCVGVLAVGAASSQAQYVLGSFQGASDPNNAGWTESGVAISTSPYASFVAAGVTDPNGPLSLQLSANGTASFGNPSTLELQFSPTQIAAFNANSYLTFTFSLPTAGYTAGYSQIYNLVLNAPGYGYNNVGSGGNAAATWGSANFQAQGNTGNNLNGEPNFYVPNGNPLLSETVTFNYSSILSSIIAGGEGYLQLTFQGNAAGLAGAPAIQDFNNVVLSTSPFGVDAVPEPTTLALAGLGGLASLVALRRKK
jgi:PEP-CTERM motif